MRQDSTRGPERRDGRAGNEECDGKRDVAVLGQRAEREADAEDHIVEPAPAGEHPEHRQQRRRGKRQREERVGVRMERLPADLGDGEQPERHRRGLEFVVEHDPRRQEDEDVDRQEQHEVEDDDRRRAEAEDREGGDLQPVVERRLRAVAGLRAPG